MVGRVQRERDRKKRQKEEIEREIEGRRDKDRLKGRGSLKIHKENKVKKDTTDDMKGTERYRRKERQRDRLMRDRRNGKS